MLHYVTFSWLFTCPKMNIICRSDLNLGLMSETFNPSHRKGLITVSSPILIIIIQHLCIDTTWSSFLYEPFLVSLRCLIDPKSVQFIVAQPGTRSIGAGILRQGGMGGNKLLNWVCCGQGVPALCIGIQGQATVYESFKVIDSVQNAVASLGFSGLHSPNQATVLLPKLSFTVYRLVLSVNYF